MPKARATQTDRPIPEEPHPRVWSGRVNPAELARPGGLLTAALAQAATERGLDLHALARTMGVSYWDLSQLRIGTRRITALPDTLRDACAAFLEVSPAVVLVMAGLLEPQAALDTLALDAQELVQVLHLRDTAAADTVLPAPSARPLAAFTVDALAGLLQRHGANPAVAAALRDELQHRPVSRTEQLRQALAVTPASAPGSDREPAIMRCVGCDTRLRIPRLDQPGDIRCPACGAEYAVHWQAAVCVVRPTAGDSDDEVPPEDETPVPDAWSVLGLPPGSPRAEVERARRALLQAYHPDRLGQVSPQVRQLAEEAFKRVNDACERLRAEH
jgi:hypothetical protein